MGYIFSLCFILMPFFITGINSDFHLRQGYVPYFLIFHQATYFSLVFRRGVVEFPHVLVGDARAPPALLEFSDVPSASPHYWVACDERERIEQLERERDETRRRLEKITKKNELLNSFLKKKGYDPDKDSNFN